jgi:hypothetical protein
MRNVRFVVLALGAIVALVALAGCGSSKTHGEEGTVKLTNPGGNSGSFGVIGKATGKSIPPGSGLAFSRPLQNSEKKTVGELNVACIATQASKEGTGGTCTATATVPSGSFALNVGGKGVLEGGGASGSIVGGSGKYNGAVGNFSSKPTSNGEGAPTNLTFNYILP